MSNPIQERRRPTGDRILRRSFGGQIPTVIEAYQATLMAQALKAFDEQEAGSVLSRIKDNFIVHHIVRREDFEEAFLQRRAEPVEVRVDWPTERVYLVGIGMPGREELRVEKIPVRDRHGDVQYYSKETYGEQRDETVLSYTEISWQDLRLAEERDERMPYELKQALCQYFKIPPYGLVAVLLALASYRDEDLQGIALYALEHS